ncbi:MAG: Virulence protein SciE type [Phenylobacterium sp.]|nr:Virulence protein SciE type [Phenylobacterium sp.]
MADANELLKAGDLGGARAALIDQVKRTPQDQPGRMFLFQLLCVLGEWDKAKAQLRALAQLSPEAQMLAVSYNMAIDAELTREQVFSGVAQPALLVGTCEWAGDLAASIGAFAQGRIDDGEARREAAFDAAPDTPGQFNGDISFDWIADADPRFGPAFEAVIQGRWGLVPFESVTSITSEGPKDLRDIIWLPVEIAFKTGQSVPAVLPARYPGTAETGEAELQLARGTDWRDSPSGQAGLGQRLWSLGDEGEAGILSLRSLTFG